MTKQTRHHEWLSLIDVSGPFLAAPVLEKVFPQGLESVDPLKRRHLRQAYDEWREALDLEDPRLVDIHQAWGELVLTEGLDLNDEEGDTLRSGDRLPDGLSYRHPESSVTLNPAYVVVDDQHEDKPLMLVAVHGPEVDLDSTIEGDGWATSPAERMVQLCRATETRLGLVTNGERWMLVDAPVGAVTTFASWYARLWSQEPMTLQAFVTLLGINRFFDAKDRRLSALLDDSLQHQDEVTDALGKQVQRAVDVLIQSLNRANHDRNQELLKGIPPGELYEAALTVMMRLVFLLNAEERELMDVVKDERFQAYYAVSSLRIQLREQAELHSEEILSHRRDAWSRLLAIFRAIYGGIEHEALRMPALGGSLFDPDRFPFLKGRTKGTSWRTDEARPLPIDNRTVLLLLDAIQLFQGRTLSYRALDIESIGHVYEGLLEHTVECAKDVILDLDATKSAKKPWVGLEELESAEEEGGKAVERLLKERTGSAISRVRNDLKKSVDPEDNARLLAACHNDQSLCNRIAPYFHLLRIDSWGYPLAYPQGSYMVTTGTDRRETGTHYTPKSLTEAIVTETLEPVAYVGPAEGEARENWRLKSSEELLDLKVCDPAMGSGAFLVQACRWLSERLLEAWQDEERAGKCIRIDGKSLDSLEGGEPLPRDVEERLLVARRLIAKRCLYGVDINPMAVELAKLSIWLVTLAKGRPFGFLDHNLRSGDSLLGIHDLDQLRCLDMEPNRAGSGRKLFAQAIDQAVDEAVELCKRLRQRLILDIHDVEAMAELDKEARRKLELPELIADALVGEVLAAGGKEVDTAALAIKVGQAIEGNAEAIDALRRKTRTRLSTDLPSGKAPRHPMHWPLEFPEVFVRDNGGFDAIVGNPPFLGNRLWKNSQGRALQVIVQMVLGAAPGKIDLCVAFHRRATDLLLMGGEYGLLATSNLAEGSAIEVGLREIVKQGDIHFSRKGMPWPGKAAVVVAIVCFHKGEWHGVRDADGKGCERIGPRLECEMADAWRPKPLENTIFAFAGVNNSKGLAFVVTPDDIWFERLRSERDSLLRPYITGNDITSHALNRRNRWVLDVGDQDLEAILKRWPIAYQFLNKVVRPTRTPEALKSYKGLYERWWQFWNHRADLMRRLRQRDRFIAFSKVTKYPICMLAPSDWIYTNQVVLIGVDREDLYPICLSSLFRSWLEAYCGGGLGVTLRLSISESMAKFPLPIMRVTQAGIDAATHFNELAVEWSAERGSGLTDLMNTIHSKDYADDQIVSLRGILGSIDTEVAAAFGWHDLDMTYDFRDIPFAKNDDGSRYVVSDTTRMEILRRLVLLNKERYGEQVAQGLHAGKKTTKKKAVLKKKRRTAKVYEIPPFTERDIPKAAEPPSPQMDIFSSSSGSQPSEQKGNQWGSEPIDQILAWLEAYPGWHGKKEIVGGSGINETDWKKAIGYLLEEGFVERQGELRGAKYRAVGTE